MAHITFIHGISNKPEPKKLHATWLRALAQNEGVDLENDQVTSTMVYWADVFYEKPLEEAGSEESAGEFENAQEMSPADLPSVDMSWRAGIRGEERELVDQMAAKLSFDVLVDDDYAPPMSEADRSLERIPLPWFLKRELMKVLLRDVHHYLFNVVYSPRAGDSYQVRDEIRNRFVAAIKEGAKREGPHIVVSHSMGTVIAYDCLKRVADCPAVDGLMTVGGPLGIDEVQDKLKPEQKGGPGWSRPEGYPTDRLRKAWVNVYDSLDPVTGFDGNIANDFKQGDVEIIEVINEQNWGKWRHNISKYLAGPKLRQALRDLLA